LVLAALQNGLREKELRAQLVRADVSFSDLGDKVDVIVAKLDPRPGRGAQGVPRTAARLSCACGAFDDKNEEVALLRFKEAARSRRRSSSKKAAERRSAK
jgi:hypothetical protein